MRIPEEIIDKIRDSADIVEIINDFVPLRRRGANFLGLCPFHNEKTPSFNVSPDKGIYKCFGCGKAGNVFSFIMDIQGVSFVESIEYLGAKLNINIPKEETVNEPKDERGDAYKALAESASYFADLLNSPEGKNAKSYFFKRGFKQETISKFMLGYAPNSWDSNYSRLQNIGFSQQDLHNAGLIIHRDQGGFYDRFRDRATFPIRDFVGRVVGFGARYLGEDVKQAKYINSPDSKIYDKSNVLYGLFEAKNAIRSSGYAILCEGYADVISLHQFGIENVVSVSGTALTEKQLQLLNRYTNRVLISFDGDPAGIAAAEKAIEPALKAGFEIEFIVLPNSEDPDSFIQKQGKNSYELYIRQAKPFFEFLLELYGRKGLLQKPNDIANFARKVLTLIAYIPDRLQHDFYIHKLSTSLGLSPEQIDTIYQEKKSIELSIKAKEVKNTERIVNRTLENPKLAPEKKENLLAAIRADEKLILNYALKGFDELNDLMERYSVGMDLFITEPAKHIFDIITSLEPEGEITLLNALSESDEIAEYDKELILGVALEQENISENWSKYRDSINSDPELAFKENIESAVNKLEIAQMEMGLEMKKNKLKNFESQEESINLLEEIMQISKDISKLRKVE